VLDNERQALVWSALAEIPETYREPLVLFYREEQSVERVAEALDLSTDAVKQRLSRGRALLREQVAGMVESALERTRPGKAFTLAVLALLPAAAPQAAAAAVAAGATGSASAQGTAASSLGAGALSPLLGVAGAYLGAKMSIENTRSLRERRYMVRLAWIAAGLSIGFAAVLLLGLLLFPRAFGHLSVQLVLAGVYTAGLVTFILRANRRQRQIQIEEGTYVDPATLPAGNLSRITPNAIHASLAGAVFGSLCWIPIIAAIARDYALGLATVAFALFLYAAGVRAALRRPEAFFRVAIVQTAAIAAWTFAAVNWRWDLWMNAYRHSRAYQPTSDLPLWAMNLLLAGLFLAIFARLALLDRHRRAR
jgi:hypothetical protein